MALDTEYILTLIADSVPERQDLEYKRDLPNKGNDTARDEFLKDVTGMANGGGGVIVFGIGEAGDNRKPILSPITEPDFDAVERRLRQLLEMVEPRIPGIRFRSIPVALGSAEYVVTLEVPQTLAGPYWNEKQRRFHVRRGTFVTHQSYQEIRTSFERGADALSRLSSWIEARASSALRDMSVDSPGVASMVCHLVPVASFTQAMTPFDLHLAFANAEQLPRLGMGFTPRWNFDGFRLTSNGEHRHTQVYRNGAIETGAVIGRVDNNGSHEIPGGALASMIRGFAVTGTTFLSTFHAPGPVVISVSIAGVGNHYLAYKENGSGWLMQAHPDRDGFSGMHRYIEDPTDPDAILATVTDTCDVIWQGFGLIQCTEFGRPGGA